MIDIGKILENQAHKYLNLDILQTTTTTAKFKTQTKLRKPTALENKETNNKRIKGQCSIYEGTNLIRNLCMA